MHVWYTKAEKRNAYKVLVVKPVGKRLLGKFYVLLTMHPCIIM